MLKTVNKIANNLSKGLAFLSIGVALLGLLFPEFWVALAGSVKVDLSGIPVLGNHYPTLNLVNILLGIIMFGMGMTLKGEDFALVVKRPKEVIVGVVGQFLCSSTLGWLVAQVIIFTGIGGAEIAGQIAVGIVLLGCVPGGTSSNVMTFLAKGDVPLSVTITMCTTLMAPIITPSFTLLLAGQWVDVDFLNMFFSIIVVVFVPIFSGLFIRTIVGEKMDEYKSFMVILSTVCILAVLGMCVGPNKTSLTSNGLSIVGVTTLAVLVHHLLGMVAGYNIGRVFKFSDSKKRTLTIEVAMQNSGLGCVLAAASFPGTLVILPCVMATIVHNVVGPIVANVFLAKDRKNDQESLN